MRFFLQLTQLLLLFTLIGCSGGTGDVAQSGSQVLAQDWASIEKQARGQTVTWAMWQGDPFINDYVANFVVPEVERRHGVKLQVVSAQGNEIISTLMTEMEARKQASAFDMLWINGETFYQLRQLQALLGRSQRSCRTHATSTSTIPSSATTSNRTAAASNVRGAMYSWR
jgi:putative spermidine/putrescine transport system substrate-binding protein